MKKVAPKIVPKPIKADNPRKELKKQVIRYSQKEDGKEVSYLLKWEVFKTWQGKPLPKDKWFWREVEYNNNMSPMEFKPKGSDYKDIPF